MSIHFISGKPGGGKSLYGVKLILEELMYGQRTIITNVPLKLPELNAYIQKTTDRAVDVVGRVWILTDDQTGAFWTYRPGGVRIPQLDKDGWARGLKPSYAGIKDSGVMYVIDEVHNFFGARQWALTGQDVLFYLSQHRKLGDTVVCITQAVQNVDKQFRSVSQDFTYLRNLQKETYGLFRLPGVFVRKTFGSPPTDNAIPMETGTFKLDVSGIASCYDTAQGVGIHGRGADQKERKKGMHWSLFFVFLAVLIAVVFFGLPRVIAAQFQTKGPVVHKGATVTSNAPSAGVSAASGSAVVNSAEVGFVKRPKLQSYAMVPGKRVLLFLSDGRVLSYPDDPGLSSVTRDYIIYRGERIDRE